jgi:hypothetical protein
LEWWDLIAYFVKRTNKDTIALRRSAQLDIEIAADRKKAVNRLLAAVKGGNANSTLLAELHEVTGVEYPTAAQQDREIMSAEQAREMVDGGMTVGAHGHSHRILAHLSPDEQRNEITTSKRILEGILGQDVKMLSYPVGGAGHYSAVTKQIVKDAGFRCAFNFLPRPWLVNPTNVDRFDINRIGVFFPTNRRLRAMLCGLP